MRKGWRRMTYRFDGEGSEPVIRIRDLRMRFGERYVLNGIDFDAYPGQIIGYIGPNGAGKSTTVKIMLGLVEGYSGEVRVCGANPVGSRQYSGFIDSTVPGTGA